jgi:hypothetical protein
VFASRHPYPPVPQNPVPKTVTVHHGGNAGRERNCSSDRNWHVRNQRSETHKQAKHKATNEPNDILNSVRPRRCSAVLGGNLSGCQSVAKRRYSRLIRSAELSGVRPNTRYACSIGGNAEGSLTAAIRFEGTCRVRPEGSRALSRDPLLHLVRLR